jgi:hypothetical protein
VKLQVECHTRFDITATGIRNHYRAHQIPGQDEFGRVIPDQAAWVRARNQQRNWDTLNQIISLRCLPENITLPEKTKENSRTVWLFRFEIPEPAAVAVPGDQLGLLIADCRDVPMITGLDEDADVGVVLDPDPEGNVTFRAIAGK